MITKKTYFGIPIQKGNITVYPEAPVGMLRAVRSKRLRTAAYVRVSTDSAQQEGSLILQREYYEAHIKNNPDYEFVEIYEDDGITATNIDKRKGFLKLMEDSRLGKIDLILVKSISRFARNVGDLLHSINMLNALNSPVEVRFEIEKISTFTPMGEMLITLLGIMAQWESQFKSEAITWAIDRLFKQGKFYVFSLLGYDKEKGRSNPLTINEEEAKTIKLCYALAVMGVPFAEIAKTMNELGLKSKRGNVRWTVNGVVSLLSNEKYAGNVLARKTVTPNYKTHKSKKNVGEKPQYFAANHHEAIVSQSVYDIALKIKNHRRGNVGGIPYLKVVSEGVFKSFVLIDKNVRGYILDDYLETSRSQCEEDNDTEINIFADKISAFDFRTYDTVSILLFEDRTKPSCTIKEGKIIFNTACRKTLGAEKVELLFQPHKAILALRPATRESDGVSIAKPLSLSAFVPVALESAGLNAEYQYRIYGIRRTKDDEIILFFDLRNVQIIQKEKDGYTLPSKYSKRYGNGFYENIATCDLYKIDNEGVWQALCESKPTDALVEQIVELTDFCQTNMAEFGIKNSNIYG